MIRTILATAVLPAAIIVGKKFEHGHHYLICKTALPDYVDEPIYKDQSFDAIDVQVGGYTYDDYEEGEQVTIMETPATSQEILAGGSPIKWVISPSLLTIADFIDLSKEARKMIKN